MFVRMRSKLKIRKFDRTATFYVSHDAPTFCNRNPLTKKFFKSHVTTRNRGHFQSRTQAGYEIRSFHSVLRRKKLAPKIKLYIEHWHRQNDNLGGQYIGAFAPSVIVLPAPVILK